MSLKKKRKNFSDINPLFYAISFRKEVIKRNLKDFFSKEKFAVRIEKEKLPDIVSSHSSNMFKNNTDQSVQLFVWCENGQLKAELRSEEEFLWKYELVEEDHHFRKNGDKYYRNSRIYRNTVEKATERLVERKLVWNNRSMVMYDYDLIPEELIRE